MRRRGRRHHVPAAVHPHPHGDRNRHPDGDSPVVAYPLRHRHPHPNADANLNAGGHAYLHPIPNVRTGSCVDGYPYPGTHSQADPFADTRTLPRRRVHTRERLPWLRVP